MELLVLITEFFAYKNDFNSSGRCTATCHNKLAADAGFEGVEVALDASGEINLESTEKDLLAVKKTVALKSICTLALK